MTHPCLLRPATRPLSDGDGLSGQSRSWLSLPFPQSPSPCARDLMPGQYFSRRTFYPQTRDNGRWLVNALNHHSTLIDVVGERLSVAMSIIETRRTGQEKSCLQHPTNDGHDIPLVIAPLQPSLCVPTSRTVVLESWASVGSVGVRCTAGLGIHSRCFRPTACLLGPGRPSGT
ncbi:hypothetical protein LZ32DRAFT_150744 [Colletotrichum eremochloae]|nr:hypothetical protein LZ32DRAFT_150744 [Colletotrichum eremochloae]